MDEPAAVERAAKPARSGGRAGADDCSRAFDRHAESDAGPELLHRAELPVAGKVEAYDVVRVDGERDVLLAWRDPDLVLSQEAPRLAGKEVKSIAAVVVGEVGVAQA